MTSCGSTSETLRRVGRRPLAAPARGAVDLVAGVLREVHDHRLARRAERARELLSSAAASCSRWTAGRPRRISHCTNTCGAGRRRAGWSRRPLRAAQHDDHAPCLAAACGGRTSRSARAEPLASGPRPGAPRNRPAGRHRAAPEPRAPLDLAGLEAARADEGAASRRRPRGSACAAGSGRTAAASATMEWLRLLPRLRLAPADGADFRHGDPRIGPRAARLQAVAERRYRAGSRLGANRTRRSTRCEPFPGADDVGDRAARHHRRGDPRKRPHHGRHRRAHGRPHVLECYGIVGMAQRSLVRSVARDARRDTLTQGVEVEPTATSCASIST